MRRTTRIRLAQVGNTTRGFAVLGAMPRYHFHIQDGVRHDDDEGIDLADDTAAEREAARLVAQLVRDDYQRLFHDGHCEVTVTDGRGLALFSMAVMVRNAAARPRGGLVLGVEQPT